MRIILLIPLLCLFGCSSFPATAGKEYSWETERNWQILNALNAASSISNKDCLSDKITTFSGLVIGPKTSDAEAVGFFAINAFVHYTISKLIYYNAPDRIWRAWNFSTQGSASWDILATQANCH